jgi:uncharacterized membrane protein YdjX (TVP38/TMEM64 family)
MAVCTTHDNTGQLRRRVLPVLLASSASVVFAATWALYRVLAEDGVAAGQSLPLSFDAVRSSTLALQHAASAHTALATLAFCCTYVFVQAWGIPGAVLLNVLGGATFGAVRGVLLADALCIIGASCAFMLSREYGPRLLSTATFRHCRINERVQPLRARVEEARAHHTLPVFLVSLRVFPGTPHWAINLAAPHAGVPLKEFAASTGVGMLPYIVLTVQAGAALSSLPVGV